MARDGSAKSLWIYILLWLLYLLQSTIWGDGTIYSQAILILVVAWSGLFFCKCFIQKHSKLPSSLKALALLLTSYCLYGGYAMMNGEKMYVLFSGEEVFPFNYIKQALISILPLYVFYYYAINNKISLRFLKLMSLVFFCVIIIVMITKEAKMLQMAIENGSKAREFTNNASYGFIYLVAYLYLFKSKKISIPFLVGIMVCLLIGMKRGAILIGVVSVLIYLHDTVSNASSKQQGGWFVSIAIVVVMMGFYISDLYQTDVYFRQRIDSTMDGSVSRRDVIINSLMSFYIEKASIFQQLFGDGANATLRHAENFAHNDWVEMLINQGLVGVIFLLSFYIALWHDIKKMRTHNNKTFLISRNILVVTLLKTIFSMSICNMLPYMTLLLGYMLAHLVLYQNAKRILSTNIGYNTGLQRRKVSAPMR